ncbi:DNA repair protein RecO [Gilvimarinus chinensis]|uniref:DNA repair protein RecO n=1 Tax=Gilvimarinus chinensis TaxID=396005 RepID=UPI0003731363|nr:DNA repair protein RecO [Gilvimarinus chinensis]
MRRVELQPAYIIHTRPYRDTSFIVHCFTPQYGILATVVRGQRQKKKSQRALLNPFIPLLISAQGKAGMLLMTHFEGAGIPHSLKGICLYSGLYLNELLHRLIPEADPHPEIFSAYQQALSELAETECPEPVLRRFEQSLLQAMGVAISWTEEALDSGPIRSEAYYRLETQQGFVPVMAGEKKTGLFYGEHILQVARQRFDLVSARQTAKRVNRCLLQALLGAKPLRSREFFNLKK